jgi:hypothetical protein
MQELQELHGWSGVLKMRDALIREENTWKVEKRLHLSKSKITFLRTNLPLFLRTIAAIEQTRKVEAARREATKMRLIYYHKSA